MVLLLEQLKELLKKHDPRRGLIRKCSVKRPLMKRNWDEIFLGCHPMVGACVWTTPRGQINRSTNLTDSMAPEHFRYRCHFNHHKGTTHAKRSKHGPICQCVCIQITLVSYFLSFFNGSNGQST